VRVIHPEGTGQVVIHALNHDPEAASRDVTGRKKLRQYVFYRIDGNRKSNAPTLRVDRGIDSHDLSVQIE
jgi:hypothetical protein